MNPPLVATVRQKYRSADWIASVQSFVAGFNHYLHDVEIDPACCPEVLAPARPGDWFRVTERYSKFYGKSLLAVQVHGTSPMDMVGLRLPSGRVLYWFRRYLLVPVVPTEAEVLRAARMVLKGE